MDTCTPQSWVDRKDYISLALVLMLLPVASQAGGLGIAAIVSLGGALTLIGLRPSKLIDIVKNAPRAFWPVMGLLVYGLISSIWSPYQSPRTMPNPVILVLGVPLYFLFARAVVSHKAAQSTWIDRIWIWGTVGSSLAILIDLTTGYSISLAIDPVASGESVEARRGDLIQNLGHGVAVLALLFPAVVIALWRRGKISRFVSIVLVITVFACGYYAGMSASIIATCLAIIFMALAVFKPKTAVILLHLFAGLSLLCAPLLAFVATKVTPTQMASLPFSWEERIHNWRFIFDKIMEHPFVGHGFDAVRTFDAKHHIRGFDDRAIVSLHPHNAGLHVWVELGLIGILAALIALYLSYVAIIRSKTIGKSAMVALCGVGGAALVNASLTFGVWQDWWWAAITTGFSLVALIPYTTENI